LTPEEVDRVLAQKTTTPMEISDLLENPYHLITCTVDDGSPIPFMIVDRGCFPDLQLPNAVPCRSIHRSTTLPTRGASRPHSSGQ
jgi:hypothetical protein